MTRHASICARLAALLLPAWLLVACGGDGSVAGNRTADRPAAVVQAGNGADEHLQADAVAPDEVPVEVPGQIDEAVRDLGLVDPTQALRIDVASAEFGTLSAEQLQMALLDGNPSVRQAAVDALLAEPEAVVLARLPQLKYALTDPDETVLVADPEMLVDAVPFRFHPGQLQTEAPGQFPSPACQPVHHRPVLVLTPFAGGRLPGRDPGQPLQADRRRRRRPQVDRFEQLQLGRSAQSSSLAASRAW